MNCFDPFEQLILKLSGCTAVRNVGVSPIRSRGIPVDIDVAVPSQRLALQYDGISHYLLVFDGKRVHPEADGHTMLMVRHSNRNLCNCISCVSTKHLSILPRILSRELGGVANRLLAPRRIRGSSQHNNHSELLTPLAWSNNTSFMVAASTYVRSANQKWIPVRGVGSLSTTCQLLRHSHFLNRLFDPLLCAASYSARASVACG